MKDKSVLVERHNKKLEQLGISYKVHLPYETGNNAKGNYTCSEGHEFRADRSRVLAGKTKCPVCNPASGRNLTHETYEARLLEIEACFFPVEKYSGTATKILHECVNGHQHMIEPARVLRKVQGCPHCSGMIKKTTESYKAELLAKGIEYVPVEEYVTVITKINHQCPTCNHIWSVKPHDILNGNGCPSCAAMGFRYDLPATLYYIRIWDKYHTYYKIGVTNKTVKQRLRNCGKEYIVLLERKYETGREAEAAEKMILEEYRESRIYAPHFLPRGGYTELFKDDILLLDVFPRDPDLNC